MNYCPGQNSKLNTPHRPKANNYSDKLFQMHPPLSSDSKSPLESSGRKHGRKSHPTQALPENERILEDEVDTLQPEDEVNFLQPKDKVNVLHPKMGYCPGQSSESNTPVGHKANNCPDQSFQKHPHRSSASKSPLESGRKKPGRKLHPTQALPEKKQILEDDVDIKSTSNLFVGF